MRTENQKRIEKMKKKKLLTEYIFPSVSFSSPSHTNIKTHLFMRVCVCFGGCQLGATASRSISSAAHGEWQTTTWAQPVVHAPYRSGPSSHRPILNTLLLPLLPFGDVLGLLVLALLALLLSLPPWKQTLHLLVPFKNPTFCPSFSAFLDTHFNTKWSTLSSSNGIPHL